MAENDINFYTIDGISIGKEIGLGAASTPFCNPLLQIGQHHPH